MAKRNTQKIVWEKAHIGGPNRYHAKLGEFKAVVDMMNNVEHGKFFYYAIYHRTDFKRLAWKEHIKTRRKAQDAAEQALKEL